MNFTDNVKHKPTLQPHSSSSILALTMAALIALSAVTTSPALAGGDTGGGTDVGNGGLKLECEAPEQTLDGLFIDAYLIDKERPTIDHARISG